MHAFLSILPLAALALGQAADTQIPIGSTVLDNIPLLGFGTWNLDRSNASEAVSHAIQTGYRHIDGAAIYGNEKLVGKGIKDGMTKAGLSRSQIWVTSKLWNDHHDPSTVPEALDQTLADLQLPYLDLYHMHWPVASAKGKNSISYLATWDAMTALLATGKVRYIGVSNFSPAQLDDLLNHTSHTPYAHQMELHPYLQQRDWVAYHATRGIHVTAYSPLAGTNPTYGKRVGPTPLLDNEVVAQIAEDRECTPAQVALAWGIGRGTSVIPKSSHAERIEENFGTGDCELTSEDVQKIKELGDEEFRYNNPSESWGVPLYGGLEGV